MTYSKNWRQYGWCTWHPLNSDCDDLINITDSISLLLLVYVYVFSFLLSSFFVLTFYISNLTSLITRMNTTIACLFVWSVYFSFVGLFRWCYYHYLLYPHYHCSLWSTQAHKTNTSTTVTLEERTLPLPLPAMWCPAGGERMNGTKFEQDRRIQFTQ